MVRFHINANGIPFICIEFSRFRWSCLLPAPSASTSVDVVAYIVWVCVGKCGKINFLIQSNVEFSFEKGIKRSRQVYQALDLDPVFADAAN